MLRRAALLALLIFQALWLNVILPGHTRGLITVPGFESSCHDSSASSCCSPVKKDKKSDQDRKAHCAVCFFAARLSLPQSIDLTPAPLQLLEIRSIPLAHSAITIPFPLTRFERGPPAV